MAFTGRTPGQMAVMDPRNPEQSPFQILRHGVISGFISAIRTLDSVTDLEVGNLLLKRVCTTPFSGEGACGPVLLRCYFQLTRFIPSYVNRQCPSALLTGQVQLC